MLRLNRSRRKKRKSISTSIITKRMISQQRPRKKRRRKTKKRIKNKTTKPKIRDSTYLSCRKSEEYCSLIQYDCMIKTY